MAEAADPVEMARLRLVQLPATFVLEPMIMPANSAEVIVTGGSTVTVVAGVVLVRRTSGGPAADHDARPVADFQVPAQRRAGGTPVSVASVTALAGGALVELVDEFGHYLGPGT